jgi:hypothetical protein
MKFLIVIIFCFLNSLTSQAQTFNEWFRQKKTQEIYLLQQIAALKFYAGYVKKGYETFDRGSKTISAIKSGDFNMHDVFFNDKIKLNPNLLKAVENLEIAQLHHAIKFKSKQSKGFISKTIDFSNNQKAYFSSVIANVEREAEGLYSNFKELKTKNELTMDDDERLKRLTDLKKEYLLLYQFINLFDNQIRGYNQQLKSEENDISTTKKILGLKPY